MLIAPLGIVFGGILILMLVALFRRRASDGHARGLAPVPPGYDRFVNRLVCPCQDGGCERDRVTGARSCEIGDPAEHGNLCKPELTFWRHGRYHSTEPCYP